MTAIEVWWGSLDREPPRDWQTVLDPEEIAALGALRQPTERERRLVARYFLRDALARHIGVRADCLRFEGQPGGKPFLREPVGSGVEFSLSHSGRWAVLALASATPVGIDLEWVDPRLRWRALADSLLDQTQVAAVRAMPEPERLRFLLQLWTRREAVAKATGRGLAAAAAGEASRRTAETSPVIRDLTAPQDYLAALAAICPEPIRVVEHHWSGPVPKV